MGRIRFLFRVLAVLLASMTSAQAAGETPLGKMFINIGNVANDAMSLVVIGFLLIGLFIFGLGLLRMTQSKREGGSPGTGVKMMLAGGALSILGTLMGFVANLIKNGA